MKKIYKRITALILLLVILICQPTAASSEPSYDNTGVYNFVSRLYKVILERNPDTEGLNGWYKQLVNGGQSGAQVVRDFLFSNEFAEKITAMRSICRRYILLCLTGNRIQRGIISGFPS